MRKVHTDEPIVLTDRHRVVLERLRDAIEGHIADSDNGLINFFMCHWLVPGQYMIRGYDDEVHDIQRFIHIQMGTMGSWITENYESFGVRTVPDSWLITTLNMQRIKPLYSNIVRLCWIERALYLGELR